MAQELVYTSAPRGLKTGSAGYTTVRATRGLDARLWHRLEQLSAYGPSEQADGEASAASAVVHQCVRLRVGGATYTVLSRIAAVGADYSGRPASLAHHVVLSADEMPPAGPAWLLEAMEASGVFVTRWDPGDLAAWLEEGPTLPDGPQAMARDCPTWVSLGGEAEQAARLARRLQRGEGTEPVWLVLPRQAMGQALGLVSEASAWLPEAARRELTLSTGYRRVAADTTCRLRVVTRDSEAARQAKRAGHARVGLRRGPSRKRPPASVASASVASSAGPSLITGSESATAPRHELTVPGLTQPMASAATESGEADPVLPPSLPAAEPRDEGGQPRGLVRDPLMWAVLGGGALLTVMLAIMVTYTLISPGWLADESGGEGALAGPSEQADDTAITEQAASPRRDRDIPSEPAPRDPAEPAPPATTVPGDASPSHAKGPADGPATDDTAKPAAGPPATAPASASPQTPATQPTPTFPIRLTVQEPRDLQRHVGARGEHRRHDWQKSPTVGWQVSHTASDGPLPFWLFASGDWRARVVSVDPDFPLDALSVPVYEAQSWRGLSPVPAVASLSVEWFTPRGASLGKARLRQSEAGVQLQFQPPEAWPEHAEPLEVWCGPPRDLRSLRYEPPSELMAQAGGSRPDAATDPDGEPGASDDAEANATDSQGPWLSLWVQREPDLPGVPQIRAGPQAKHLTVLEPKRKQSWTPLQRNSQGSDLLVKVLVAEGLAVRLNQQKLMSDPLRSPEGSARRSWSLLFHRHVHDERPLGRLRLRRLPEGVAMRWEWLQDASVPGQADPRASLRANLRLQILISGPEREHRRWVVLATATPGSESPAASP